MEHVTGVEPDVRSVFEFTLNGEPVEVVCAPNRSLAEVLREDLGMTGTKTACDMGVCGSCSVLVDGRIVKSGGKELAIHLEEHGYAWAHEAARSAEPVRT